MQVVQQSAAIEWSTFHYLPSLVCSISFIESSFSVALCGGAHMFHCSQLGCSESGHCSSELECFHEFFVQLSGHFAFFGTQSADVFHPFVIATLRGLMPDRLSIFIIISAHKVSIDLSAQLK